MMGAARKRGGAVALEKTASQTWRRRYVPWLFLATLLGLLVGQGLGLVPPRSLAFRAFQAAPMIVVGLWLYLGAVQSGLLRPGVTTWALHRDGRLAWGFFQLVLALCLLAFALAMMVGG